ncbi:unnamed protein product [Cladocopium goreaui]|uniref:Uncharacterized protein n=1 Tax=Cladocopium goreaui TaxID=2562237 RepID=A0A9P1BLK5_9DINO|nr:unnamed protein product [Cladocopium goreaui]
MDPSDATLATLATAHKRHISDATTRHSCHSCHSCQCPLSITKLSKVSDGLVTFQHPASALASHPWHPEIIAVHVTEVAKSGTLMAVKEGKLSVREFEKGFSAFSDSRLQQVELSQDQTLKNPEI